MKQVSATVISNLELMPGYHLIYVDAPDIAATSQPGQFVTVRCGEELTLRRPLSIHQLTDSKNLCLLFKIAGKGTLWLSQRKKNEALDLIGPLGKGFSIEPTSKKLLLVAGGIGIAPLVFLAQKALSEKRSVKLLLGARTKDELYPQKLLPSGIEIIITTEDGSDGEKGKITDILSRYVDWTDQIYACGPLDMYRIIEHQRQRWFVKKPIQVSLEVRMGCGLGACFSCSIKTRHDMKQVCRDGPVFNLDEIILEEVKI
ncbi:MAG: dihydroorotate dehydrogenase electron transfer subunit [Chloroflexi bacterium]|nr:dihydroorotate dehydrogenase electron transfer subunit [Chloroflexota bacterium]